MPDETTGLVSSKKSMSKHTYIHTEKKDQNRSNRRHFGGANGEIQIGTAHNRKIPMLSFLDVIIQYDYIGDLVLGGT